MIYKIMYISLREEKIFLFIIWDKKSSEISQIFECMYICIVQSVVLKEKKS